MASCEAGPSPQVLEHGHVKKPGMTADSKVLETTCKTGETSKCVTAAKKDLSKKDSSCLKGNRFSTSFDSSKKFPPFRTGKYVPKETVYSPLCKTEGISSSCSSPRGKSSNEKLNISPTCSPPPLRANKSSNRVSSVYASPEEKFDKNCVKVKLGPQRGSRTSGDIPGIKTQDRNSCPDSPRSSKGRLLSYENRRACSLEGIAKQLPISTLKNATQISHSADSVDERKSKPKTRPKSYSIENAERRCSRTQTETSPRPKSFDSYSPRQQLSKSAKGALNPLHKIIEDNARSHSSVERRDKLTPLSPKSSKKTTIAKDRPKSITLVESRPGRDNQENRIYLRKGSDSRDQRPPRPHSAVILSSSESERSYRQNKYRKARRLPQRNIYVKRRRKPVNAPKGTPQRTSAKNTKYKEQEKNKVKIIKDEVDSTNVLPTEKVKTFSVFADKFCVRTKRNDKEIIVPKLKRCRVMVWKIRRISYDLYEKVQKAMILKCILLFKWNFHWELSVILFK